MVTLKSSAHFSTSEKDLLKEVFKVTPGECERLNLEIIRVKEENSRLYFELKASYDTSKDLLCRLRDSFRVASDFAKAIMTLEDRVIESNYSLTIAKRNKAP